MKRKVLVFGLLTTLLFAAGCDVDKKEKEETSTEVSTVADDNVTVDSVEETADSSEEASTDSEEETADSSEVASTDSEEATDSSKDETQLDGGAETWDLQELDSIYADFLKNVSKAEIGQNVRVGYDDFELEHEGEMVTVKDLITLSCNQYSDAEPTISYKIINREGNELLYIRIYGIGIEGSNDDSYAVYVVVKNGDKLTVTYGDCAWSRRDLAYFPSGLVYDSGSGGACDHGSDRGFIDKDGKYQFLCETRICQETYIQYLFSDGIIYEFSEEVKNAAENVDYQEEDEVFLYKIGDQVYLNIFTSNTDFSELLKALEKEDVTVEKLAVFENIFEAHAESFGFSTEDLNDKRIEWIKLN